MPETHRNFLTHAMLTIRKEFDEALPTVPTTKGVELACVVDNVLKEMQIPAFPQIDIFSDDNDAAQLTLDAIWEWQVSLRTERDRMKAIANAKFGGLTDKFNKSDVIVYTDPLGKVMTTFSGETTNQFLKAFIAKLEHLAAFKREHDFNVSVLGKSGAVALEIRQLRNAVHLHLSE